MFLVSASVLLACNSLSFASFSKTFACASEILRFATCVEISKTLGCW